MKSFIVFATLVAAALAAPVDSDSGAQVVKYESDNIGVGGFRYAYGTSNGIQAEEQGELKNVGSENEAQVVRGQFSYIAPDGVTYQVTYIADENGFQPQGAHLPQVA